MPQMRRCPHCNKTIRIPDSAAGKQVRCPSCRKEFAVAKNPVLEPAAAIGAGAFPGTKSRVAEPRLPAPQGSTRSSTIATTTVCPACNTALLPGAVACLDCGYLVQPRPESLKPERASSPEEQPVLCLNPACGVANSPTDRVCERCGSPLPAAPGTVLHGRYRIERQLAVGGFGAVYRATDFKEGDRPVAIKDMICADPLEFTIRMNFFRREAEILRALQDLPIVPRFYDFIQQGQAAHLVMELIQGQDLLKIMEANGSHPFPLDQVVRWGRSICDVLTHMHNYSPPLVYRDLKPDNIMLLEDQSDIKLIDFGTARDMGRTHRTRMAAKTRVYTEGYAPPEQIVGKPEPRSDLFALAGTLYHLTTGIPPEGFYTARELEKQLAGEPVASGVSERSGAQVITDLAHRWFFELIKINLAEDANDRYFSAREFKKDLELQRITKEVNCANCQTINKVREPYCLKCAAPLTDATPPCGHCGKQNRMGSRCCIYCGNRLR
jgi:serine/threonine protein kinase